MDSRFRWIAFGVLAVVAIALIAVFAPRTMPGATDAQQQQATTESVAVGCEINPYFRKSPLLGEWQTLEAWTRGETGARYTFNPFAMDCDPATGHRDVWLQIEYRAPQTETFEDADVVENVTFSRERFLYRIDCQGRQFQVLERRIMGVEPEAVAKSIPLVDRAAVQLEPFRQGGVAAILAPPVCSTGRL
jgi:hypothetical protein